MWGAFHWAQCICNPPLNFTHYPWCIVDARCTYAVYTGECFHINLYPCCYYHLLKECHSFQWDIDPTIISTCGLNHSKKALSNALKKKWFPNHDNDYHLWPRQNNHRQPLFWVKKQKKLLPQEENNPSKYHLKLIIQKILHRSRTRFPEGKTLSFRATNTIHLEFDLQLLEEQELPPAGYAGSFMPAFISTFKSTTFVDSRD